MGNPNEKTAQDKRDNWTVDHDKNKCALCVVCAKNCPTDALRRDVEGASLALYFNANLCDGCGGEALCEAQCPEEAIKSLPADKPAEESGFVLLNQSAMAQCQYCDEYFAPIRRLEVIGKKGGEGHDVDQVYCPLCRRTNLVVQFIEETRAPGSKAEYRSAKDILRKAQKRIDSE